MTDLCFSNLLVCRQVYFALTVSYNHLLLLDGISRPAYSFNSILDVVKSRMMLNDKLELKPTLHALGS